MKWRWTHKTQDGLRVRKLCEARGITASFSGEKDGLDDWVVCYDTRLGDVWWVPVEEFKRRMRPRE